MITQKLKISNGTVVIKAWGSRTSTMTRTQFRGQWRRSQVKSGGDKYWENLRGGVWGGAVPSPVGGLGACPQKKNQFPLKIMQFWASFGTSFLYYSRKWGIIPQSWKWGTYPPAPPPLLRRQCPRVTTKNYKVRVEPHSNWEHLHYLLITG